MKKYLVTALVFLATTAATFAQKKHAKKEVQPKDTVAVFSKLPATATAPAPKRDWSKLNLTRRANDHFMVQLGYDNWAGTPDSVHIRGFNRSFNFYFMFDFPFKTDPRFSVGAGLGIGTSNIFFDHQVPLVAAAGNGTLAFPTLTGTNNDFKKNKLVTTSLQVPVELRFAVDPEHTNSSWKFAVGVKVGLLMSAYTKQKTQLNGAGQVVVNSIQKESSKQYFNTPQLIGTARINKGFIGVFGQYQVTSLIKANAGAAINPFSVGIMLSGL